MAATQSSVSREFFKAIMRGKREDIDYVLSLLNDNQWLAKEMDDGDTPLHCVVYAHTNNDMSLGDVEKVTDALLARGASLEDKDAHGVTVIKMACDTGTIDLEALMKKKLNNAASKPDSPS